MSAQARTAWRGRKQIRSNSLGNGVVVVRIFPAKVFSGLNGHMNKRFHGKNGSNGPKLFAFERLIAGDLHSRAHVTVLDGDVVVVSGLSEAFDSHGKLIVTF